MLKVGNANTRRRHEIYSKLIIKAPERGRYKYGLQQALTKRYEIQLLIFLLFTLSWRRFLSYRNQFIDLVCESMDWFLYDRDLRHERVKILPKFSVTSTLMGGWVNISDTKKINSKYRCFEN